MFAIPVLWVISFILSGTILGLWYFVPKIRLSNIYSNYITFSLRRWIRWFRSDLHGLQVPLYFGTMALYVRGNRSLPCDAFLHWTAILTFSPRMVCESCRRGVLYTFLRLKLTALNALGLQLLSNLMCGVWSRPRNLSDEVFSEQKVLVKNLAWSFTKRLLVAV